MSDMDKADKILALLEQHQLDTKEQRRETKEWRDKIEERMEKAEHQLFLYKTIINLMKWLAGALIVLLSFKGGDIVKYFTSSSP